MAPELRKRKPVAGSADSGSVVPNSEGPSKRKAAQDSSPLGRKKKKSSGPAGSKARNRTDSGKTEALAKDVEPITKDAFIAFDDETSDSGGDGDETRQQLARQLDPADDVRNDGSLFHPGQDVGKIPKVVKHGKSDASRSDAEPGVVYIGRIPHGFYEHEMREYFAQFGPISKLRLSRNKKTGASKHFAFIEFAEENTAEIVVKTMDNYLLFGHILKCRSIPKEQVHDDLFKGANKRFKKIPWNKMAGKALEKPLSESAWEQRILNEQRRRAGKASKLQALGYDFRPPGLKDVPAPREIDEAREDIKSIKAPQKEEDLQNVAGDQLVEDIAPMTAPAVGEAKPISLNKSTKKSKGSQSTTARRAKV